MLIRELLAESRAQEIVHKNPTVGTLKALAKNNKYGAVRFVIYKDGTVVAADSEHFTHHSMAPAQGAWDVRGYVQHLNGDDYAYKSMNVHDPKPKDHPIFRRWEKMGIENGNDSEVEMAEGTLYEIRDRMYQFIKSILPTWPDYIIKDLVYNNVARGNQTTADPDKFSKETILQLLSNNGLSPNTKWTLYPAFEFKMEKLHPDTQRRLKEREGGSKNPYQVPNDTERHDTQAQLAKQQGGIRKEPVIGVMTPQGFELLEGWHRTIQHFKMYPNGYKGPAYIAKVNQISENFADGKVKGKSKPGRVKKAGASCKGSVTDLRAKAKKYGGERGKMYHWCSNMKAGRKKKVSEDTDDRKQMIADFVKFALKHLDCEHKPKIKLVTDNATVQDFKSFGGTNIHNGEIWVYISRRNLADVLRTLCHELVHYKQFKDGRIKGPEDGKTGSELENEANAKAGVILRHYGKMKPAIFESK